MTPGKRERTAQRRAKARWLHDDDGLSIREIARRLGVSPSTIHADLRRATSTDVVPNLQGPDGRPVAGAERGNTRAVTHGVHSPRVVAERAESIRTQLFELVPVRTDADTPAITLLSNQLARISLVNDWLNEVGILDAKGEPRSVLGMLTRWENSAAKMCDQLGLTPTARVRLGLDLSRVEPSMVQRMQEGKGP